MDADTLRWVKSNRSSGGGECLEAAADGELVHVRDDKDKTGPVLTFTRAEWVAFIGGVRDGDFDFFGPVE